MASALGGRIGIAEVMLSLSVGILVIVVAVPVLIIFFNALWVGGQLNLADMVKVLGEPDTYRALLNSLFIASGVTLMSTLVGTFFAWLVTRTDLPLKAAMKVLFLVPFMLPSCPSLDQATTTTPSASTATWGSVCVPLV